MGFEGNGKATQRVDYQRMNLQIFPFNAAEKYYQHKGVESSWLPIQLF